MDLGGSADARTAGGTGVEMLVVPEVVPYRGMGVHSRGKGESEEAADNAVHDRVGWSGVSGRDDEFAAHSVVFHVGVSLHDLVQGVDGADRGQGGVLGDSVQVVTVSQDMNGAEAVGPFFAQRKFAHLPQWLDPKNSLAVAYGMPWLSGELTPPR